MSESESLESYPICTSCATEKSTDQKFTIVFGSSEAPETYQLPISHANRSVTLACLIPSSTFTFTLPIACQREYVALCAHALALLSHSPRAFLYDSSQDEMPVDYDPLTKGLSSLQLRQVGEVALRLRMSSFVSFLGDKMYELSNGSKRSNNNASSSNHPTVSVYVQPSTTVPIQLVASHVDQTNDRSITLISDSGVSYPMRRSLASLAPALAEAVEAGNNCIELRGSDDQSIELTIGFLELLSREPLIIRSESFSQGQSLSDKVPSSFADLLHDRIQFSDGSRSRLMDVCIALKLETLATLLNLKICALMVEMNANGTLRQAFNQTI